MSMKIFVLLAMVLLICGAVYPQEDSTYTAPAAVGDYVDLSGTTIEIKIEPDRPRITLFKRRIEPEFGSVDLDKSFMPELQGKGEQMELIEEGAHQQSATLETIDINTALNKPRKH